MSKEDLSNKTLAILVGVAIVVSLMGILSVRQPEIFYYPLTGFIGAVSNGTVSADITRSNIITVTGSISFGSGTIFGNNSEQPFVLNSTSTYLGGGDRCAPNATFAGSSCTMQNDGDNRFIVQNDGNINLTVLMDINTTNANLRLGTGGDFAFWLGQEEPVACLNFTGAKAITPGQRYFPNETGSRATSSGIPVSIYSVLGQGAGSSQVKICEKLQPDDASDAINLTIYLNISKSASSGSKNYLLNFTGVDAFGTEG